RAGARAAHRGGGPPAGPVAGGGEGEALVLRGELGLAGPGLAARREGRVAVDERELPAVDTALGVDLVEARLHRLEQRDAELAHRAALDEEPAELDRIGGDADVGGATVALRRGRSGGRAGGAGTRPARGGGG